MNMFRNIIAAALLALILSGCSAITKVFPDRRTHNASIELKPEAFVPDPYMEPLVAAIIPKTEEFTGPAAIEFEEAPAKSERNQIIIDPEETVNVGITKYDPFDNGNDMIEINLDKMVGEFTYPFHGNVTSRYGIRNGRMHSGLDIDLETGDTIRCILSGVVRMSRYYSAYGNVVVVRHHNGIESVYSHNSKNLVEVGEAVSSGAPLALGGHTGRATGSHLHFELRIMGEPFNPEIMLDTRNRTLQANDILVLSRPGSGKAVASTSASLLYEASLPTMHTVKSGDNLYRIAGNYGTTVAALCRLNNISSSSIIRPGQRLKVR